MGRSPAVGKAVAQGAAVPQHQHQAVLLAGAQQDPAGQGRQLQEPEQQRERQQQQSPQA
jgi:hypothetical protein